MSVLVHFEFCAFKFCCGCYSNVIVSFTIFLVPNVIESGRNVYQSLGVPLKDSANYNIISRSSYSDVFCENRVAEISCKILQKQL